MDLCSDLKGKVNKAVRHENEWEIFSSKGYSLNFSSEKRDLFALSGKLSTSTFCKLSFIVKAK